MICFFDTDIFLKLVAFGLLEQALAALGVTSEKEVYVTPEVASKCRHSKRERKDFRQEILNKALDCLKKVTVISKPGDPDELVSLLEYQAAIGFGERTLFLATKGNTDFILLTGDKRALRALTNNFLSQELHSRHIGRIVCLEAIILLIIKREGFGSVREKLIREPQCDEVIQKALRDGKANEAEFIETLERHLGWLQEESQGLLIKV